jgi:hypothetical protein
MPPVPVRLDRQAGPGISEVDDGYETTDLTNLVLKVRFGKGSSMKDAQ